MKILKFFLSRSLKQIVIGLIGSLVAAGLYTLGIKTLNLFTTAGADEQGLYLLYLSLLFISSSVITIFISHLTTSHLEQRMVSLRKELSLKILKSNFERAESNRAKFVPVLNTDLIQLSSFAKMMPDAAVAFFQIIGVMNYLVSLSVEMTLSFTLLMVLAFSVVFVLYPVIYRVEKVSAEVRNRLFVSIEALGSGLKDLSLNPKHKDWYVQKEVVTISNDNANLVTKLNTLDVGMTKTIETLILVSLGLVIYILRFITDFDNEGFYTFLTIMLFILPAFVRLATFIKRYKKAQVSMEQIENLDFRFEEIESPARQSMVGTLNAEKNDPIISLKGVKYTYTESEQQFTVGAFDLDVHHNEILLIRGGNGSGKTTLAKILTGLYLPQFGEVRFCKELIRSENLISYRSQFSAVFTDSYVFSNLSYIEDFNLASAQSLLDDLDLNAKVDLQGFKISNTKLSFGQMGRLSLFRTIMEDKDLILLDEWAANQDPHFKEKFYLEIIPALKAKGKTIILISHDDHYYHIADRIVKMRAGTIEKTQINKLPPIKSSSI